MLVKTDRVIYYLTNFTILTFFKSKTTWHLWRFCYVEYNFLQLFQSTQC